MKNDKDNLLDDDEGRDIVKQVNNVVLKLNRAMPDFIKIDNGDNFQAAKRARKIVLDIEKKDIPKLKESIKEARVAREYKSKPNKLIT